VALAKRERTKIPLWHFIPRTWNTLAKNRGQYDFSNEVAESMAGCLACKSCTGQCPIKVDVPEFRARFFQIYYGRYLRPLKDYFVGLLEFIIPVLTFSPFKFLYNFLMSNSIFIKILKNVAGMVDSPLIHKLNIRKELYKRNVSYADASVLNKLTEIEKEKTVVIVQDAFTSFFETDMVLEFVELLQALGFRIWMMPYQPNGKPLHVHGFLHTFKWVATRNQRKLQKIAQSGVSMIGVDPAMTLAYRGEYSKYVESSMPEVMLVQEFLVSKIDTLTEQKNKFHTGNAKMLGHCTEKTNAPASASQWEQVFSALNQTLKQQPVGCCGMAGTYGHETKNRNNSEGIYDLSWREVIKSQPTETLIATGYSCRSQVKRLDKKKIAHPLQFLHSQLIKQ
jgi:Fe-S oxidoreductase